jgi:hypothetical protein
MIAWRRLRAGVVEAPPPGDKGPQFSALTVALLVMMGIGLLAMGWDTAFWPFLRFDALWTYGYNAKVFMLESRIPRWIDYYPQLVPLSFTFGDLVWGRHNDHAARAAVPWFFLSSAFSAYLLGWRVYGRHLTGILTAALWVLIPSALVWSSAGDLEHPMAFYFTMAAVFFTLAWREALPGDEQQDKETERRRLADRYALIAGLMLAGAMWTKPTAGAFVLGIGLTLVTAAGIAYRRQARNWFFAKLRVAIVAGLAAAPIGGMWYIRNVLLGHAWTILPAHYWQDLAQRSGMQLVWLWALAVLATAILAANGWRREQRVQAVATPLGALVMLSIAVLPTALSLPQDGWTWQTSWAWINGFREPSRRLNVIEGVLLLAGATLLMWSGRRFWREQPEPLRQGWLITWGLGLPFFAVYFWSFSYHYRLGLTVLPLILAPIAALLVGGAVPLVTRNRLRRWAFALMAVLLGLPAPIAATYHTALNSLNGTGVDTDREKYAYANPALMQTVNFLEGYAPGLGQERLRVLAPGEGRLQFFFPTWHINSRAVPLSVDHLAGYDLYISVFDEGLWRADGLIPNQIRAWKEMAWVYPLPPWNERPSDGPFGRPWRKVFRPVTVIYDDGNNRYQIFAVDAGAAYQAVEPETPLGNVVFGGTMQLLGYDLPTRTFRAGETYTLKFYWRGAVDGPPREDYSIFVHLLDPATGELLAQRDGGLMWGLFPTRLLTPGLVLQDRREWQFPSGVRPGPAVLRIGVYTPRPGGLRLPATVNGEPVGDGVVLETEIQIE